VTILFWHFRNRRRCLHFFLRDVFYLFLAPLDTLQDPVVSPSRKVFHSSPITRRTITAIAIIASELILESFTPLTTKCLLSSHIVTSSLPMPRSSLIASCPRFLPYIGFRTYFNSLSVIAPPPMKAVIRETIHSRGSGRSCWNSGDNNRPEFVEEIINRCGFRLYPEANKLRSPFICPLCHR
jgi:hypothetical protein